MNGAFTSINPQEGSAGPLNRVLRNGFEFQGVFIGSQSSNEFLSPGAAEISLGNRSSQIVFGTESLAVIESPPTGSKYVVYFYLLTQIINAADIQVLYILDAVTGTLSAPVNLVNGPAVYGPFDVTHGVLPPPLNVKGFGYEAYIKVSGFTFPARYRFTAYTSWYDIVPV